jgi:hypothetical protein
MAAKKKSASRRSAAKVKGKKAPKRPAAKKAAARKGKKAAKKSATRRKKPPLAARAPARKAAPRTAPPSPALAELDRRIALVRNNLRDLTEQAASTSGSASEEALSDRIANQEAELRRLGQERDTLAKS